MEMPDKVRDYLHAILLLSAASGTIISGAIFWAAVTFTGYLLAAAAFIVGLLLWGGAAVVKPKETQSAIDALPEIGRLKHPAD